VSIEAVNCCSEAHRTGRRERLCRERCEAVIVVSQGFAEVVGGVCDVDHIDAIKYYTEDPDIKQIYVHIEVSNGKAAEAHGMLYNLINMF
jgi:hypothetical protein